ncbi:sensor domain-containing diguanylate cyclase, partial [bacterium]
RQRVRSFEEAYGLVVEDLQVPIEAGHRGRPGAQVLSVTILKLDAERLMAVIKDITDVVRRERQLRHAQAWIETIVNGLADYALLELDEHGRIRESNVGLERVTGFGAGAAGRPFTLFLPKERVTDFTVADRLTEARESGWSLDEGWRHRADGSRFWGSCLIAPLSVEGDAEPGFSLILRDISHARESREQIRDAVFADHLTGLANRRCFHESAALELARWRRQPRPLSVLAIDADHFKAINDRYGHLAGDAVLRHLAVGLSGQFRSVDLLARFGGEEFVALLPGTDLAGAEALAQRAVESLAACPATVDGVSIPCTISIGVAAMSPAIDDLAALLQQADDALYAAKAAGRNRAMRWRPHHARVAAASGSP